MKAERIVIRAGQIVKSEDLTKKDPLRIVIKSGGKFDCTVEDLYDFGKNGTSICVKNNGTLVAIRKRKK
jgi:hypothetical protein